jgi:homoserine kinase type II
LVVAQVRAVLDGYQQYRRFEPIELSALPAMLRLAALRFWLSRLYDATFPLSGELTFIKRPEVYREMLISRGRPNQEFEELGKALSKSA